MTRSSVLTEVAAERYRQDLKWGQQNHPDGTGQNPLRADLARQACERAFAEGRGTWRHILREEVFEAFGEDDPARLREELIQVAAVAVAWVEKIDRDLRAREQAGAHVHDRDGQLDRSICGACGDAYVECSGCGVYRCECTRCADHPNEGNEDA